MSQLEQFKKLFDDCGIKYHVENPEPLVTREYRVAPFWPQTGELPRIEFNTLLVTHGGYGGNSFYAFDETGKFVGHMSLQLPPGY